MTQFVLGYGSLVAEGEAAHVVALTGARRAWTVAMDNSVDLPGYKHYVDDEGLRPAVCVAFLDLVPGGPGPVNGVCRPVTTEGLAALDRRERQYERVDVTDRVEGPRGRIWTYVGHAGSRARASAARGNGRLVVVRSYLDTVLAGFDALGPQHRAGFDASTEPPGVPVVDLLRVDAR